MMLNHTLSVQPKNKNYNLSVLRPSNQVTKKPLTGEKNEKENNKTIIYTNGKGKMKHKI